MSARGSSLRKRAISFQRVASTTTVSSPTCGCVSMTDAGNCFFRSSTRAFDISHRRPTDPRAAKLHEPEIRIFGRIGAGLHDGRAAIALLNLVLQEHEAVEHGFGPGRTTWNVDVAGDDFVDAGNRRVVVVKAAARSAGAEREHPLRIRHLLVDALEDRRLALRDGADHPQKVRLAR